MRIMVLDSDRDSLNSVARRFKSAGATSGKLFTSTGAALTEISTTDQPFDCIVMGQSRDALDSLVACRLIRRLHGHENTPIFIVEDSTDAETIDAVFAAGANDMVSRDDLENHPEAALQAARDLRSADRQHRSSLPGHGAAIEGAGEKPSFSLKVPIHSVPHFVDRATFDNYIRKLSDADQFDTRIFAVRVDGMVEIHEQRPYGEFCTILTEVAAALSQTFPANKRLFSYSGGGVFICSYHGTAPVNREALADQILAAIDEVLAGMGLASPEHLKVRVGSTRKALGVLRSEVEPSDADPEMEPERRGLSTAEFLARRKRVMSTMLIRH